MRSRRDRDHGRTRELYDYSARIGARASPTTRDRVGDVGDANRAVTTGRSGDAGREEGRDVGLAYFPPHRDSARSPDQSLTVRAEHLSRSPRRRDHVRPSRPENDARRAGHGHQLLNLYAVGAEGSIAPDVQPVRLRRPSLSQVLRKVRAAALTAESGPAPCATCGATSTTKGFCDSCGASVDSVPDVAVLTTGARFTVRGETIELLRPQVGGDWSGRSDSGRHYLVSEWTAALCGPGSPT